MSDMRKLTELGDKIHTVQELLRQVRSTEADLVSQLNTLWEQYREEEGRNE